MTELEEYVQHIIDAAPTPSDELLTRVADLLTGTPEREAA